MAETLFHQQLLHILQREAEKPKCYHLSFDYWCEEIKISLRPLFRDLAQKHTHTYPYHPWVFYDWRGNGMWQQLSLIGLFCRNIDYSMCVLLWIQRMDTMCALRAGGIPNAWIIAAVNIHPNLHMTSKCVRIQSQKITYFSSHLTWTQFSVPSPTADAPPVIE